MAHEPARIGYAYRYAQGKTASTEQLMPGGFTSAQRAEWVRGWKVADQDHAAGRPSRLPVAPPEAPPPTAPAPEPEPPPEPETPAVVAETPAPPVRDPEAPRIVKAKVKAAEAPPAAPVVVLANKAPPVEQPPPWLLLRVHRDETGFRVESEGSDAVLPGNGIDALTMAIKVHLRLRLGPDEDEWRK